MGINNKLKGVAMTPTYKAWRKKMKGPPCLRPSAKSLTMYVLSRLVVTPLLNHAAKSARRNQRTSDLLRMPPEIRNKIYEMTLDTADYRLHTSHLTWDRLSLSRTCHQIFTETATIYHAKKLIPLSCILHHASSIDFRLPIVEHLTPSQKFAIRHVSLNWSCAHVLRGSKCVF
jgi:hypothetical protein